MQDEKVKVIYIAGAGRSGTTLLDILIGERKGYFSAGELRWIWWGGLIEGWQCGCTLPVRECPVWNSIFEAAYGKRASELDAQRLLHLQQNTVRLHFLPRILSKAPDRPLDWPELEEYASVWNRLYVGIAQATGARVVVDSSKNTPEAALLRLLPNVDPYVIHLVRDPRGVANSFKRTVKMEPTATRTFDQPRRSTAISSLIWARKNIAADLARVRFPRDRMLMVRYEDVVARPRETLERIAYFTGDTLDGLDYVDGRVAILTTNHTAWGNPSRFRTGEIVLRPDDEWKSKLKTADRILSTGLTLPLLLRYGFSLAPRS